MAKLTLQYIWVEKYGCFENAEFNFSAKHHFHYDKETNTLTHEDHSKDYVEGFFGENVDLTAVVGNNGAGKTTVLDLIGDLFGTHQIMPYHKSDSAPISTKIIFAVEVVHEDSKAENSKLHVFFYQFEELLIATGNCNPLISCHNVNSLRIAERQVSNEEEFTFSSVILLSNVFEKKNSTEYNKNNIFDLSTVGLIAKENFRQSTDINKEFFFSEFERQIRFLKDYGEPEKYIGFKLPDECLVRLKDITCFLDGVAEKVCANISISIQHKLFDIPGFDENYMINENRSTENKNLANHLKEFLPNQNNYLVFLYFNIIIALIDEIAELINIQPQQRTRYADSFHKLLMNFNLFPLPKFYDKNDNFIKKKDRYIFEEFVIELKKEEELFNLGIDTLVGFYENFIFYFENNGFEFSESGEITLSVNNAPNGLNEFFTHYRETAHSIDYLGFEWKTRLSSGETGMLNLYSRFFSLSKGRIRENALILIDEADMLFHPEWQQKYINSLLPFLKDIYPNTHLQIIIATHSPIMLSDIPKQNVIYLHSEKNVNGKWKYSVEDSSNHAETFGANIFRLFDDAFFLQKGAIGAFAEEKLKELLELIDNSANENKEEIQKRIRLIGDPFLKSKVETFFLSKIKDEDIQKQQRLIENEIAFLNQKLAALKAKETEEDNPNGEN